jgi:hypothetical protein
MLVDERDPFPADPSGQETGNIGLTIWVAALKYKRNDHVHSQGNYDYEAHAHV